MRTSAAVLAGLGLLYRLAFVLLTPAFQAPDEQAHYRYVRFLVERHALPVQTSRVNAPSQDWEYYQPPLYYLALAPVYALARALPGDGDLVALRTLRLCSVLMWALTLWLIWRALGALRVRDPVVAVTAIAVAALLPSYVFISSMVNNDNLLILLSTAVLGLTVSGRSGRDLLRIGALLGLAFLTKLSAAVLVVAIVACYALHVVRGALPARRAAREVALILAITGVIVLPWAIRMVHVYGDLTAEGLANVPVSWPSWRAGLLVCVRYLGSTFWAVAGVYNNVPYRPQVGTALTVSAGLGLLVTAGRHLRSRGMVGNPEHPARAAHLGAFALALAVNLAMTLGFGFRYGWAQGRFLFPLLLPIGLLLGLSWRALVPAALARAAAILIGTFFAAYAFGFTRYALAALARG